MLIAVVVAALKGLLAVEGRGRVSCVEGRGGRKVLTVVVLAVKSKCEGCCLSGLCALG
jgi:hypothetical protein